MADLPINISTASVPEDYCPQSFAEGWTFGVGLLSASLSGSNTTFSFGPDTPPPDDQDRPWFKTDANFKPDAFYTFSDGAWISKHPIAPGVVVMWEGAEANIPTFDGGEAGTVTETTGPMWEKVTSMDARFPMGPGTLPSGTAVAVGAQGGEEKHTIAQAELPNVKLGTESIRRTNVEASGAGDATVFGPDTTTGSFVVDTPLQTDSMNGGVDQVAGNNLPPFTAIWFIRRTARKYYRL